DKKNIDDVKNLQNTLNSIGCNAGYVDGVWGKKTIAAVLQFAKKADLFTSSDNLITDQLLSALSKAKKGFCPKPEIPSHWIAKQSCEKLDEPIIWTLNTQKSSKNKYSYSSPSDSSAVGIFEIMGNRIKITDFNDDGTKNLMQGSISSDRKNIDIFVNMDKFDLGNCTLKLKGVNHDFRFMPITSGLDYNQKMYGIAKCTNGMNSQNIKVKAFNDFWADKSGEYLTTRYHFNDEGLVWTHRFACYNKEFCLGKRYGNIILKRGEISLEIKTPKWGQCQISIK
ncbi:peptidoglycan-binding protein, partial [Amylibacter sp.]|nr:peptidoglycan-binding protein [Amylibacter sp.]